MKKYLLKLKKRIRQERIPFHYALIGRFQPKIFCIGRNKTGTTSVEAVLKEFGYKMGHQPTAEKLLPHYAARNWKPILDYCNTAQSFQDAPFSWPETWRVLVKKYPNAKYILTYRDELKWFNSVTKFQSKVFADGKRLPTKEDLKNAKYRYPGWAWDAFLAVSGHPETELYNKDQYIANYLKYNEEIISYFQGNPNFLAIDVSKRESYKKLCSFLGKAALYDRFPHKNKTSEK